MSLLQKYKSKLRDGLVCSSGFLLGKVRRKKYRARVIALHDIPIAAQNDFIKKIHWLAKNHRVVSLENLYSHTNLDDRGLNVALTFDDGLKEHYSFVAPFLEKFNIPATFFVSSGSLDLGAEESKQFVKNGLRRKTPLQFMNSEEVKVLSSRPLFEIGGHTTHHVDLGQINDLTELGKEIIHDKLALEKIINRPLRWFAFPFGSLKNISEEAIRTIKQVGYQASFTIVPSFWSDGRNPYLIGRDSLSAESGIDLWNGFLLGGYDPISWVKSHYYIMLRHR